VQKNQLPFMTCLVLLLTAPAPGQSLLAADEAGPVTTRISVTIDRGQDVGQSFGALFEASSGDGSLVIGAGFQNAYNTRYRADRHAIQFFIRPTSGRREMTIEKLPRPTDNLTGAYLLARDGTVYSTYGGLKSWNAKTRTWDTAVEPVGTGETMRVGNGTLAFGNSSVTWNGRTILEPPSQGSYQLFFYANGHLCFYHVNRGDRPYREYKDDEDGFSRLYACPWTPAQDKVDLAEAVVLRLPVVGETTFAWGQLRNQIVTGSNIGGFYVFEDGAWRTLLKPNIGVSYQLYSTLGFHDRLLMGQYPTGRVFEYDGKKITDQPGWPPVLQGVSDRAREAQTTAIYGGDLFVGVWPWGEVWRNNPDSQQWIFMRRMFEHPALSADIVHPYDVENRNNSPGNLWGQRVTSLVVNGADLFISTSAKAPYEWEPGRYPFLAPDKWKSYGKVYRATMPGHLSASTKWSDGPTRLEFVIREREISIHQDGVLLATSPLTGTLAAQTRKAGSFKNIKWGSGIYGPHGGVSLKGVIANP
jgi:hypothetical protein